MEERLDIRLCRQGLCASRERAKECILSGRVTVNGTIATKPGAKIAEDAIVTMQGEDIPFVSRGGCKLDKIVKAYHPKLEGAVCIDVGASTGGFTDCMLQNGAARVYAVDVGTDQLAEVLREDARVISMEQTDIRDVTKERLGEEADFVSADVAFISLGRVLPAIARLMKDGGEGVFLIKPQFEAGREHVGKHGVVKERKVHREVLMRVTAEAEMHGFRCLALEYSPICGQNGNIEYLLYARYAPNNIRMAGGLTKQQAERITDEAFLYHSKQGKGSNGSIHH